MPQEESSKDKKNKKKNLSFRMGNLVDYDQSLDQEHTTSVSFASVLFY
jgi:hypothetical protein